jgi:hypothetical protein
MAEELNSNYMAMAKSISNVSANMRKYLPQDHNPDSGRHEFDQQSLGKLRRIREQCKGLAFAAFGRDTQPVQDDADEVTPQMIIREETAKHLPALILAQNIETLDHAGRKLTAIGHMWLSVSYTIS